MKWSILVAGLMVALSGCDSSSESDPEPEPEAVEPLAAAGQNGLVVRLMDTLPAPPDRGDNRWIIEVANEGKMLSGCELTVEPDMPLHGHGTEPVEISEKGEGLYEIDAMNLFMPGEWVIPIEMKCGEMTDRVEYKFWIEG